MKNAPTGIGDNKLREKLTAKARAETMAEAKLKARKVKAIKAIAFGSAALDIVALGLFGATKSGKKKSFFS